MRNKTGKRQTMFIINVEPHIAKCHPLRAIEPRCDQDLSKLVIDFSRANNRTGRLNMPLDDFVTDVDSHLYSGIRDI